MSDSPHQTPTTAADLRGSDQRTLTQLFQHPLTHNLSLRAVTGLFDAIGSATVQHNGDLHFQLGDDALTMQRPHDKDLSASEVMNLRHLLERKGWSPNGPMPEPANTDAATDLVIIIDHAAAQVHQLNVPDTPHQMLHEIDRSQHDADREETYPADQRFFEEIARAATHAARIVLIGHGKGQANEADHLTDYLRTHHKDIHARIVRKIVADLSHLKTHELMDLARHALATPTDSHPQRNPAANPKGAP